MNKTYAVAWIAALSTVASACTSSEEVDFDEEFELAGEMNDGKADGASCPLPRAAIARVRAATRSAMQTASARDKRALAKTEAALLSVGVRLGALDSNGKNLKRSVYYLQPNALAAFQSDLRAAAAHIANRTALRTLHSFVVSAADQVAAQNAIATAPSLQLVNCMTDGSQAAFFSTVEFDEQELPSNDTQARGLQPKFDAAAAAEQSLWYDTILEGDYSLTSDAKVGDISAIVIGGTRFGYRVSISASAVGTWDDCSHNETTDRWEGDGCVAGSISVTRTFNLAGVALETEDYAEFSD